MFCPHHAEITRAGNGISRDTARILALPVPQVPARTDMADLCFTLLLLKKIREGTRCGCCTRNAQRERAVRARALELCAIVCNRPGF